MTSRIEPTIGTDLATEERTPLVAAGHVIVHKPIEVFFLDGLHEGQGTVDVGQVVPHAVIHNLVSWEQPNGFF